MTDILNAPITQMEIASVGDPLAGSLVPIQITNLISYLASQGISPGGGGGVSFSDYQGIVVVDAAGNGDYTTVTAAIADGALVDDTTVYLFGDVTEPGGITISTETMIIIANYSTWTIAGALSITDLCAISGHSWFQSQLLISGSFDITTQGTTAYFSNLFINKTAADAAITADNPQSGFNIINCLVAQDLKVEGFLSASGILRNSQIGGRILMVGNSSAILVVNNCHFNDSPSSNHTLTDGLLKVYASRIHENMTVGGSFNLEIYNSVTADIAWSAAVDTNCIIRNTQLGSLSAVTAVQTLDIAYSVCGGFGANISPAIANINVAGGAVV